jgi:hypothetical protein
VAAAAIGTIGALVELTRHRWDSPEGLPEDAIADTSPTTAELQDKPASQPALRKTH